MKRILAVLLFGLLTCVPALAFWQSRDSNYNQNIISSGGGCSQATTFLVRTSGLSGTETTAYTTMICGMVTDGTWSLMDALYIFSTNNTTTAVLNLVSTSFGATIVNAPAFSADHGFTGSSTTGTGGNYLNTNYTPSTAGGNCTLNSCAIGVYDLSSRAVSANEEMGGQVTASTQATELGVFFTGSVELGDVNDFTFPSKSVSGSSGLSIIDRTVSTSVQFYKNGSANGSTATALSTSLPAANIFILGVNVTATSGVSVPSSDQLSAAFISGGLTSTQASNVSARINALMTTLGINAY